MIETKLKEFEEKFIEKSKLSHTYALKGGIVYMSLEDFLKQALEDIYKQGKEAAALQFGLKDNEETLQDNGYYAVCISKEEVDSFLKGDTNE